MLRKVPGALALGLLASVAAHAALFGDGHAMGGPYHAFLVEAALAAGIGLMTFFAALAWSEGRTAADGSVVASRLRERFPSLSGVVASATLWYAIAEAIEPHHAPAPAVLALVTLAACAWLVLRLAGAIVRVLRAAIFAILVVSFAPRTPAWPRRPQPPPFVRRPPCLRRRFARPPPIIAATRA